MATSALCSRCQGFLTGRGQTEKLILRPVRCTGHFRDLFIRRSYTDGGTITSSNNVPQTNPLLLSKRLQTFRSDRHLQTLSSGIPARTYGFSATCRAMPYDVDVKSFRFVLISILFWYTCTISMYTHQFELTIYAVIIIHCSYTACVGLRLGYACAFSMILQCDSTLAAPCHKKTLYS